MTNIEIPFSFFSYTKQNLVNYIFGENAKIDYAIPNEDRKRINENSNDHNKHYFYVMDYTNNIFGELVNLKEAFFNKVASEAIK